MITTNFTTMNKPKGSPNKETRRTGNQPTVRKKGDSEDSERTIPGKRTPESEKLNKRVVNEDEQQQAVNNKEDNAQTKGGLSNEDADAQSYQEPNHEKDTNEELEASDDQNEVHPRARKVN